MNSSNEFYCSCCGRGLNQLDKPDTESFFDECVRCRADMGDPDCLEIMASIDPEGYKKEDLQ